ncbi:MAG: DUF6541 family protein, partial [Actinomycetes bacterium]
GLLGLHPSMLFTAALFTLPFLVQRWWGGSLGYGPRRIGVELGLLVMPGVVIAALVAPHLNGALSAAQAVLAFVWPPEVTPAHALGEVLGFSTMQPYPQVWLLVFLVIGMAGLRSLRRLRWLPVAGAVFAGLFVLSASYSTPWAQKITSPWWNDKYRLAAVATVALLPVVAHGLVCTYDALLTRLVLPALRRLPGTSPSWAAPVSITAVCAVFLLLADGGYAQRNIQRTAEVYGPGPTVSPVERKAFGVLKELVKPGERVMNDRYDGSGWMYALDGVRPVAAHFSTQAIGDGPDLLAGNVDDYDSRPDVRAAVAQLDVKWVIVGPGFVWASMRRQGGLEQLSRVRAFDLVYDEGGVQIYQVARPVAPSAPPSSLPASVPGAGGPPGGPG